MNTPRYRVNWAGNFDKLEFFFHSLRLARNKMDVLYERAVGTGRPGTCILWDLKRPGFWLHQWTLKYEDIPRPTKRDLGQQEYKISWPANKVKWATVGYKITLENGAWVNGEWFGPGEYLQNAKT